MASQGIEMLAYYLGMDYSDVRDYEYQAGNFTQKVFFIGDNLYCPYRSKPKDRFDSYAKEHWRRIEELPFPYQDSILWVYDEKFTLDV